MASVPGTTNEGTHFPGISFVSPSVGHIGPPYIATLTLPGLTIGLPVWLFSTPVNVNDPSASSISTPPQDHQPHVDPLPSSPIGSSSHSSSSPSEISATSNQVDKKKKKRKIKKKKNKLGGKLPTTGQDMLEVINQLLFIMLGVLIMSTSLSRHITSPNSLAGFVRVTTFLRISLVFPRL
jgi:hypothetical protein